MEYIIGRGTGANVGQLVIKSVQTKKVYGINMVNIPNSVSREHCRISVDPQTGVTVLTNLQLENSTWVNGLEIVEQRVKPEDNIALGCNRFPVSLHSILAAIASEIPKVYDISHLEKVWKDYQKEKLALSVKQGKMAAVQSVTGVLTMSAFVISIIPGASSGNIRVALYVVAIALTAFFVIYRYCTAGKYVKLQQALEERFHKDYVCPNPSCQRFMGLTPYEDLVKSSKKCSVCQCGYSHK